MPTIIELKNGFSAGAIGTIWTPFTMIIGAQTTAPTKGTIAVDEARWRRLADSMEIYYYYRQTATGSSGVGRYLFPIPSPYVIDVTKAIADDGQARQVVGHCELNGTGTTGPGYVGINDSGNLILWVGAGGGVGAGEASALGVTAATSISFKAIVPIVGWT